jgi:hypothetical protein
MILSAIADKLKRRSKDDFKGRHFEASLILQAVPWYLRYRGHDRIRRKTRVRLTASAPDRSDIARRG